MNAYVDCVGCEQRELDSQRVINYLQKNDVNILNSPTKADYVFIITCGVDSSNERQSIDKIQKVSEKMSDSSKLIVGGCLPSISPDLLEQFEIYHTFSPRSIESLDAVLGLDSSIGNTDHPNKSVYDHTSDDEETTARDRFEQAKNGYKVKIAEGCLSACNYCMIREATGLLRSESIDHIISQVEKGIKQYEKTIMLMAGDTGAYGKDIGTNFATLLGEIVNLQGDFKIYVHDFGINWLINDLPNHLKVFEDAEMKEKIGGMTLPIQSGSNNVLKLMGRKYGKEDAIFTLKEIKKFSFDIGTHIMVGFPGEAEENFNETISLLNEIDFDFVTCFPYSENPRAVSASLPNKVSERIVEERLERITHLFGSKVKVMK